MNSERIPFDERAAQLLASIVESSEDAILSKDINGIITSWNGAAQRLFGYTAEEILGKPVLTLIPMDRHHEEPVILGRIRRGERIEHFDTLRRRKDGTLIEISLTISPLRDADGNVVGASKIARDITDRRRAEQAAQLLASIVASSEDAIISKNLDGTITSWNGAAQNLFGYSAEEMIGRPIAILIPAERNDEEPRIIERIRRGERMDHYETIRRRKDGSLVEISLTVSPIKDESGRIVGASKIARDITERKRDEERIRLLAREVDHRAKNLLALVQATVHLSQGATTAELKTAIEGRLRAIGNAHSLFAQSRWEGANLRTLVREELAPFSPNSGGRVFTEGPDVTLEPGTAQSFAVVLHELTTNAAKYGALCGPKGEVRIAWTHDRATGEVAFRWQERGGPPVTPPTKRGFGTRVMEQLVQRQMNGVVTFDWDAAGLNVSMVIRPRIG